LTDIIAKVLQGIISDHTKVLEKVFLTTLAESIVKEIEARYKLPDEGIILHPSDDGSSLRNGALAFTIQAFIDVSVQMCANQAVKMIEHGFEKLNNFKKVFVNIFAHKEMAAQGLPGFQEDEIKKFQDKLRFSLENASGGVKLG
jgi:hypothetical protein